MDKKKTFSVEETVKSDFEKAAREDALNQSQWLENKMQEYLKERGKSRKK